MGHRFAVAALAAVIMAYSNLQSTSAQALGAQPIKDRYIVVFKETVRRPDIEAENIVRAARGELHFTYSAAIKGFAATLPEGAVRALSRNPNVAYVEQDMTVSLSGQQSGATWGLDRLDQRSLPLDTKFNYPEGLGAVYAFIIDTGVLATHVEFTGRMNVSAGYTAINDRRGTTDCNGHGTHVAGTVAGTKYGVAKTATVIPIRVLDCRGSGTNSGVIAGVDHVGKSTLRPAVANMSLGGGASTALDSAVAKAVSNGITVVVAAGNSNVDACTVSPARTPSAITVGATTSVDARASYSNFGTCVDVFAPGSSITSAWFKSTTAINTISGTSMASPHVAGVAAQILGRDRSLDPASVAARISADATQGKVTSPGSGSPNLLLYSQQP